MSRIVRLVLAASLLLLPVSVATADSLLAAFNFTGSLPTPIGQPEFSPLLSYGDPSNQPAVGYLDNVALTLLDIIQGNRYEMTGDLANFAALASNGVNDGLYVGFGLTGVGTVWSLENESTVLSTAFLAMPGLGNPDFAGYDVTRVLVMGTAYGPAPNDEVEISLNFEVYGDRVIPEPSTWAMLLIGASVLVGCRRLCRR